jgi:hypothetical protein
MDLRSVQRPLKEQYRTDPNSSRITLTAKSSQTTTPVACAVDVGRTAYLAEAHSGVGGAGTAACSGDLLLAEDARGVECGSLQCSSSNTNAFFIVTLSETLDTHPETLHFLFYFIGTGPLSLQDRRSD